MWSRGDSSRLLSSLSYALPSWQSDISPGTLVFLLILSACSAYQIQVSRGLGRGGGGGECTRATAFDLQKVEVVVLECVPPYFLPPNVAVGV